MSLDQRHPGPAPKLVERATTDAAIACGSACTYRGVSFPSVFCSDAFSGLWRCLGALVWILLLVTTHFVVYRLAFLLSSSCCVPTPQVACLLCISPAFYTSAPKERKLYIQMETMCRCGRPRDWMKDGGKRLEKEGIVGIVDTMLAGEESGRRDVLVSSGVIACSQSCPEGSLYAREWPCRQCKKQYLYTFNWFFTSTVGRVCIQPERAPESAPLLEMNVMLWLSFFLGWKECHE